MKVMPTTPSPSPETDIEEDDMEEEEEEVVEDEADEDEEDGNDEEAAEVEEEPEEEEAATTVKDQEEYEYPIDSHFQGQDYMDNFYYDKTAKASTQPQTRADNGEFSV